MLLLFFYFVYLKALTTILSFSREASELAFKAWNMTTDPWSNLSAQQVAEALLQHQHQLHIEITNLHSAMIQRAQHLGQSLPQLGVAPQVAPQPLLLWSPGSLLEKFSGAQDQFLTFTIQCELFMVKRPVEFPTDRSKVAFVLSLLKEGAAWWAIPLIESNDAVLDNYQNFMQRFRAAFDIATRRDINNWEKYKLKQGNNHVHE